MAACDDEVYDFEGDSTNRVYVKSMNNQVNGADATITVLGTPLSVNKTTASFPVSCTLPDDGELKVAFSVDPALVDNYNSENGTSYVALPKDDVEILNDVLTIPVGAMESSDMLSVTVLDEAVRELSTGTYLIGLEISGISGGGAEVSTNRNSMFVAVEVSKDEDNIYDDMPDASAVGNLLSEDRSGWNISFQNSSTWGTIGNLFDGNANTSIEYVVSEWNEETGFIVDMQKVYPSISGVTCGFTYSFWASYYLTSMDIYTSLDNRTWTYQGHLDNYSTSAQAIFYAPVSARYIKIIALEAASSSIYMTEFNIYVKD